MPIDTFTPPPAGQLSEQVDLPDCLMSMGLIHPEGCSIRVATWNGAEMRHMSPAAARRLANELGLAGHLASLAPVIAGLRKLAARAEEIAEQAEATANAYLEMDDLDAEAGGLAEMEVEGHA